MTRDIASSTILGSIVTRVSLVSAIFFIPVVLHVIIRDIMPILVNSWSSVEVAHEHVSTVQFPK